MSYVKSTALSKIYRPGSIPAMDVACTLASVGALFLNFLAADGHDQQRCVELVVLLFCSCAIVLRGPAGLVFPSSRPARLLLLSFFAFGLASALLAWSPRHALYEWSSMLLLVMLIFVVARVAAETDGAGLLRILQFMGLACLLYSLRVLLMYAAALVNGFQLNIIYGLAIGFSNARFLNHTQTALLPLLVLLCLQAPTGKLPRAVWFVLAAFWWSLLYVTEARASVLALGAGCALSFLLCREQARGFLKLMSLTALAGIVVYALGFVLLPMLAGLQSLGSVTNVIERTAANPTSNRQFLWARALELIAAHPWLGVGPMHFAHYGADLQAGAHPHDWILQIAVEWGVPALLCALCLLGLGFRTLLRSAGRIPPTDLRNQQFLTLFVTAGVAIFVDGLFSGVLVMPQSRLAIALVAGCAVGWVRSLEGAARPVSMAMPLRNGISALALASACVLVYAIAPGFLAHARGESLRAAGQVANPGIYWPRMWEDGYF
jgi:O-antigen ligase